MNEERRSISLEQYAAEADEGVIKCPRCNWERCVMLFNRERKAKYVCRQCGNRFWRTIVSEED